jgi:hypothetical protein
MSKKPPEVQEDLTGPMRELREYARGTLDVDHSDVSHVAGLVDDPEVRQLLLFANRVYDPTGDMPRNFWDTEFAEEIVENHSTEKASKAIKQGDQSSAAYLTGVPSYESDVSGMQAINQLVEWLIHSEQCKLVYLAALMGRGKTDLSLLLLETIHDHYRRVDRSTEEEISTPQFAANFYAEGEAPIKLIDNYDDLVDWAETGSSDENRWFVFDEASTELTAQSGANAQNVAETMAPFVKKMRKKGVNMIVIGHDKGDVHPAIRSIADFVDKTGLKTASFYAGIKKREPTGHLFDLAGLPPTSWSFDTDDMAEWDWCLDEEDDEIEGIPEEEFIEYRNERIARLYAQTDISQAELATAMDVSQSTVSDAWKSHKDNLAESIDSGNTALAD